MDKFTSHDTGNGNKTTFNKYLSQVFTIVFLGTFISFAASLAMYLTDNILFYFINPYIIVVAQLCIAWFFSSLLPKMKNETAWTCYILYAILLGINYSVLPLLYDGKSILIAVAMTCILFGIMAFAGHFTRIDLSKYSFYFFILLLSIIILSVINFVFLHSNTMDLLIAYITIFIFLGVTAYDVQRLRNLYITGMSNPEINEKLLIYGAFMLYLDFINIFINLLEILGRKDDN